MKSLVCAAALVTLCAAAFAGQLYLWTDDDGRTHITDSIPDKYRARARLYDTDSFKASAPVREAAPVAAPDRKLAAGAERAAREKKQATPLERPGRDKKNGNVVDHAARDKEMAAVVQRDWRDRSPPDTESTWTEPRVVLRVMSAASARERAAARAAAQSSNR